MTPPMPDRLEVCARILNNSRCLGVLFKPTPETWYCYRCSSTEAGIVYALPDPLIEAERRRAERVIYAVHFYYSVIVADLLKKDSD
jgi:hypothetical protein